MDTTFKKIHECIKRTLIFESGKPFKPLSFCFVNVYDVDNVCSGTQPAQEEEVRENRDFRFNCLPNDSRCVSCPFLKQEFFVSDILKLIRDNLLINFQNNSLDEERTLSYLISIIDDRFFSVLFEKVKQRCYLTFTESDRRTAFAKIHAMSAQQIFELIDSMEKFCKENNIK